MDAFRFVHPQPVEFRDLDGLGHVNNAVYLSYVESARLAYMQEVLGPLELDELGIVAEARISFRSSACLGETLAVGTRVAEIGTKSIRFEFEIQGTDGRLIADGSTVHVAFDYQTQTSIPVPEEWRRKIDAYETRGLRRDGSACGEGLGQAAGSTRSVARLDSLGAERGGRDAPRTGPQPQVLPIPPQGSGSLATT